MSGAFSPGVLDRVPVTEFCGVKVISNPNLMKKGDPVTVRRSWKERLLTRPWRPFEATRTHTPMVPDTSVYRISSGWLVAHPITIAKVRAQLEAFQS